MSLEKTAQFVSDVTNGALSPCVGMINGLCREFSLKATKAGDIITMIEILEYAHDTEALVYTGWIFAVGCF